MASIPQFSKFHIQGYLKYNCGERLIGWLFQYSVQMKLNELQETVDQYGKFNVRTFFSAKTIQNDVQ